MANQKHLDLIDQGMAVWNEWRENNPEERPDLSEADLSGADLSWANLSGANLSDTYLCRADLSGAYLSGADLSRANLNGADLKWANLNGANLNGADLSEAILGGANLNGADLSGANLSITNLVEANLTGADLSGANLTEADLSRANLSEADLSGADLSWADFGWSTFSGVDLSVAKGLDKVTHYGPSSIDIDTIYKSKGNIPKVFLRGAGVPKDFIEYVTLLARKPIELYSCFISYSTEDREFAERLHTDLQSRQVRCWFAPEHMKIGDKIRQTIDHTIRAYDKLLLVLSKHSIDSEWVEKEVETAFEEERRRKKKTVLFPIRLDSSVMDTDEAWAADIRRTRHIGNFVQWKDHDEYKKAFDRLLRDLKAVD